MELGKYLKFKDLEEAYKMTAYKKPIIAVKTLGSFKIKCGENLFDGNSNRSIKVQLLLAYFLLNHGKIVSKNELISLIWDKSDSEADVNTSLKTALHRSKKMLSGVIDEKISDLIEWSSSGYVCGKNYEIMLDVEIFESLYNKASAENDTKAKLDYYLEALELYEGEFLPKLSYSTFIITAAEYYKNLYNSATISAASILNELGRDEEAVEICEKALKLDPYNEDICLSLFLSLKALKKYNDIIMAYETLRKKFYQEFGVHLNDDIKDAYHEALKLENDNDFSLDMLKKQLKDLRSSSRAIVCDYNSFKLIYQAHERLIERTGDATHIAFLSLKGKGHTALSKRNLDVASSNLIEVIATNLRRGDAVCQYNNALVNVLLPLANYENSCMVCDRIIKAFNKQYPHTPVEIHYFIQPLGDE